MLIDAHVHVNSYDEDEPKTLEQTAEALFAAMEEAGVSHSVILTSYLVTPERPHVDDVIEHFGNDPRVTIIEGLRWRAEGERTDLFRMEERIRDGLVKGIKLYPGYESYAINDPSLETVFRLAQKYRVPVLVHTGDTYSKHAKVRYAHPLLVDDIAVDYPDVSFVMCHCGNPWFQDSAEVLYKNDNVYADISGLSLGDIEADFEIYMIRKLKDMITYMGDPGTQLMYGSDWPLVRMRSYVRFFRSLDLDEEQMEGVAWRTAAKLFRIDTNRLKS